MIRGRCVKERERGQRDARVVSERHKVERQRDAGRGKVSAKGQKSRQFSLRRIRAQSFAVAATCPGFIS